MFQNEFGSGETKSNNPEENIAFHYSRQHRLESAPQEVRDAYNGNFTLNKGIKVLFTNKSNRFLLISLVILTAFAFFYGKISSGTSKSNLGPYNLELSAFAFEENIYASLKINENQKKQASEREPVTLNISFAFYDVNNQLFESADYAVLIDKEEKIQGHKITDYDIKEVAVTISNGSATKTLKSQIKR